MLLVSTLCWAVALGALVAAAITDVADRIIPNRVTLLIALLGLVSRMAAGPEAALISVAVAVVVLFALVPLAQRDMIGGGDAKLIPAVTLLLPAQHVPHLLLSICLAGGLLSCIYLVARRYAGANGPLDESQTAGLSGVLRAERTKIASGEPMPYAVAILAGTAYAILTEAAQCFSATSCSL